MTPKNLYGDDLSASNDGKGVDIASQRIDDLDRAALNFTRTLKNPIALDLGGGQGAHALRLYDAGARVIMVDIDDFRSDAFHAKEASSGGGLSFVQKDFTALASEDIPAGLNLLYSQRAIHYLRHADALSLLKRIADRMTPEARAFLSVAGFDSEYGLTFPTWHDAVENRFDFVTPDMQEKHGIRHRITPYTAAEFSDLLQKAGLPPENVTVSAFGNVKAVARKG